MLRANSWQWIAFEDTAGRVEIKDPASYRATFNTDASLGSRPTATTPRVPTRGKAAT